MSTRGVLDRPVSGSAPDGGLDWFEYDNAIVLRFAIARLVWGVVAFSSDSRGAEVVYRSCRIVPESRRAIRRSNNAHLGSRHASRG